MVVLYFRGKRMWRPKYPDGEQGSVGGSCSQRTWVAISAEVADPKLMFISRRERSFSALRLFRDA
jgi:hypothetical protein